MKKISLLVALFLTLAGSAQARNEKLFLIDMTGSKFVSDSFNLMGDSISNVDGFGIKLDGEAGKDFAVDAKASNAKEPCSVEVVKSNRKQTVLRIIENLDVDSGDTCDISITYRNGPHAVLSLSSEGT